MIWSADWLSQIRLPKRFSCKQENLFYYLAPSPPQVETMKMDPSTTWECNDLKFIVKINYFSGGKW